MFDILLRLSVTLHTELVSENKSRGFEGNVVSFLSALVLFKSVGLPKSKEN